MEDKQIIELYWKRMEQAINETRTKYGRLILAIGLHLLKNRSDAEECENDTYLGAWNAMPPKRPQLLQPFLARIARNQALKKYRYLHAGKRAAVVLPLDELGEGIVSEDSGEFRYEDSLLLDTINSFLEELSPESRKVFVLRYWYFASVKEIMEQYGMSKSKVESLLFRTRNKLRAYLCERGFLG